MLNNIKAFGFFLALFGSAFSNSVCGIGLGTYVGALILQKAFGRGTDLPPFPCGRLLLPLLLSLAVSVAISDYFVISLKGYGKYLQGFALLYAAVDVLRPQKNRVFLLWTMAAAYLLASVSAVYQEIFGVDFVRGYVPNLYTTGITRLTGTFKHCTDFGTFLVPGVAVILALWVEALQKKRVSGSAFFALLLGLITYALLRTLSRGALLSSLAAVFFFGFFFRFRWLMTAGVAGAFGLAWVIPSPLRDRMHDLLSVRLGDTSERLTLLQTTAKMVLASPVFGLGLNTYSDHFPRFKPADYPAQMYTHNSYLQMASEAGILGTALYLLFTAALLFGAARALARVQDQRTRFLGLGLAAGAFGFLVNCLFESALQSTQLRTLFWILLGSAVALSGSCDRIPPCPPKKPA